MNDRSSDGPEDVTDQLLSAYGTDSDNSEHGFDSGFGASKPDIKEIKGIQERVKYLEYARNCLLEENLRLKHCFEDCPVGILLVDINGILVSVNRTAQNILLQDQRYLIGQTIQGLVCPEDQDLFHRHIQRVKYSNDTHSVTLRFMRGDGVLLHIRMESARRNDEFGAFEGVSIVLSDVTPKYRYKLLLRKANNFQRTLIDCSPFAIISTDTKGIIQTVNPSAERMFGYASDELVGIVTPLQFFISREVRSAATALGKSLESLDFMHLFTLPCFAGNNSRNEWTYTRKDGERRSMSLNVAEVNDANGALAGLIFEAIDVTERKRQDAIIKKLNRSLQRRHMQLHSEKFRAQTTLMSITDGVIITNRNGRIQNINPTAEKLVGYDESEAVGMYIRDIFPLCDDDDNVVQSLVGQCIRSKKPVSSSGALILKSRGGKRYHIEKSVSPILDNFGSMVGVVVVFRDVTHNIRMIKKMLYQATHDELTGLVNRREFNRCLQGVLDKLANAAQDASASILVLDLDRFKAVNDTCGHVAGDALLRQISGKIKALAGERAVVARMGGDEFAILLQEISFEATYNKALEILTGVQTHRFEWENHVFKIGVSIGIRIIDHGSSSLTDVQSEADAAAYMAKKAGRNRIHVYGENSDSFYVQPSLGWFNKITRAIDENQLLLFAQHIRPLDSGKGDRIELLLRMRSPDGGIILPSSFIPTAERYNLMPAVDRWVVENAFSWLAQHPRLLRDTEWFSINLSGPSLSEDGFYHFLKGQFKKWYIPYHKICFEITETMGILNVEGTLRLMNDFRKMGCLFSLDDFGSGYSSYETLKKLPVEFIKIDGNFVKDAVSSSVDLAIVRSIKDIGVAMGKKTIAEFVEDNRTFNAMREIGVDYVQGFYFDKPTSLVNCLPG